MSDINNTSNSIKEIKKGSIISYFTIFLNIILGLIYTPWILHTIGSSDYGLYTLASSFVALFLLDFGMSMAVSRFISNYRAKNKQDCINSFIGLSIKFYVVICAIAAVALLIAFFFLEKIYTGLTPQEVSKFKIIYVMTGFFVIFCFPVNIFNGILNAYEKYVYLKGTDVVNKIGTVVATIIALLIYPNVFVLVAIISFFNVLSFITKVIIVFKKTPARISFSKNEEVTFKSVFSFSALSTLNTISQQLTINLIPTVLGMVTNSLAITIYGFARVIEGYVYNISQGINGFFMPSVSRIVKDKDDAKDVLPLMKKVGRINYSVIALLLIGLGVLGKEFVHLWAGDEYKELYFCFIFLTAHYLISAPQQIANTSVNVLNKLKYTSTANLLFSLISLVAVYFVSSKFGVLGTCVVVFIFNILKQIYYNFIYIKVLKINIWSFLKDCYLKTLFPVLLTLILSFVFIYFVPLNADGLIGWVYFFIKVVTITLIYFILMWFFGWNKDEKNLIKSFIPFLKKKNNF